ncbi:MAG: metallopeptidase family protein [Bacteroidota bacterium]|nr:metallopeptidase family protein [Bacteroidota bacterium]
MDRQQFENIVEEAFQHLPPLFKKNIENVEIVVEDFPSSAINRNMNTGKGSMLLGLYQGVPLTHRGTGYGMAPVLPDRIFLFRRSIEQLCRNDDEVRYKIYEVLCHEIGHYFGMNEHQIRTAMKGWQYE